tara:strand:- start:2769 stop:2915 length:147 start_codon:yes stop_codon:yes gene_type:complete
VAKRITVTELDWFTLSDKQLANKIEACYKIDKTKKKTRWAKKERLEQF